jgi:hypothetical protein
VQTYNVTRIRNIYHLFFFRQKKHLTWMNFFLNHYLLFQRFQKQFYKCCRSSMFWSICAGFKDKLVIIFFLFESTNRRFFGPWRWSIQTTSAQNYLTPTKKRLAAKFSVCSCDHLGINLPITPVVLLSTQGFDPFNSWKHRKVLFRAFIVAASHIDVLL